MNQSFLRMVKREKREFVYIQDKNFKKTHHMYVSMYLEHCISALFNSLTGTSCLGRVSSLIPREFGLNTL